MRIPAVLLLLAWVACGSSEPAPEPSANPAAAVSSVTDSAQIHGYSLELVDEAGSCRLRYESPKDSGGLTLEAGPPCHFLRRDSVDPQSFAYPDVGVEAVLIVAGDPVSDAVREEWNLASDLVCGSVIQGVLIRAEGLVAGGVLRDGVWCRDRGADEKDFFHFAHRERGG